MDTFLLRFRLESDATFGRGDGVAGLVNEEVQHDEYGLPYLSGRALKGLFRAECADILFALGAGAPSQAERWGKAAQRLFGDAGSVTADSAILRIGDARMPQDLRAAIAQDVEGKSISRAEVLETLTALRRQTSMNPETGAPMKDTLRTMRVIIRKTPFEAELEFLEPATDDDKALLAACVKAFRRAGTAKTRGRGRLAAELFEAGSSSAVTHFKLFSTAVKA